MAREVARVIVLMAITGGFVAAVYIAALALAVAAWS